MPLIEFSLETLTCVREDSDLAAGTEPYLWAAAIVIDPKLELRDGRAMAALFPRAGLIDESPARLGNDIVGSQQIAIPAEQGNFAFEAKSPSQDRYRFLLIVMLWDEDIADQEFADAGYRGFKQAIAKIIDRSSIATRLAPAAQGDTTARDQIRDEISSILEMSIRQSITAEISVGRPPVDIDDFIGSQSVTLGGRNGTFLLDIHGNDAVIPELSENRWLVGGKYSNPEIPRPEAACLDDRRNVALAMQRLSISEAKLANLQVLLGTARPQDKPRLGRQITAQEELVSTARRAVDRAQAQLQQCVQRHQTATAIEGGFAHDIFVSF